MNLSLVRNACLGLLLCVAADLHAADIPSEMATAARRLLASLDAKQKQAAAYPFADDKREGWHFIPDKFIQPDGKRHGLVLNAMNAQQRLLTHALLSTALSGHGYRQTLAVMSLEQILHEMENNNPIRDSGLYYVSIFGTPSREATWGWRFEGHHLSINVTLVDGWMVSLTPSFFGANPGTVPSGPHAGLSVLAEEQLLARQLTASFGPEQRKAAIISAEAPADILTAQERVADRGMFLPARGVAATNLDDGQLQLLERLVRTFAWKYRPELLKQINDRKRILDPSSVHFAWAGSTEPGKPCYFRVQSRFFLFEYDNTQNGANHVHAVWRDFDGDFGRDLLADHHKAAHANN